MFKNFPALPQELPGNPPGKSRKFPGNVPGISRAAQFSGSLKVTGKRYLRNLGNTEEESSKIPRFFCGKSQTPCRKKSGEIPGNFLGKLPGSSWQNRWKITGILGETPGQLLGSSWVSAGFPRFEGYENTRFLLPRRPPGGSKPMQTQGVSCSTDTAGRLNKFENTRFSLPRRPPGGPKPMKIQGIRSAIGRGLGPGHRGLGLGHRGLGRGLVLGVSLKDAPGAAWARALAAPWAAVWAAAWGVP